jgi:hypothetical protein
MRNTSAFVPNDDLRVATPPRADAPLASAHPPFWQLAQKKAVVMAFGIYA